MKINVLVIFIYIYILKILKINVLVICENSLYKYYIDYNTYIVYKDDIG